MEPKLFEWPRDYNRGWAEQTIVTVLGPLKISWPLPMFREPPESKVLMGVIQGVHKTLDRMWSTLETQEIDWDLLTSIKRGQ